MTESRGDSSTIIDPEDRAILDIVRNLCLRLELSDYRPQRIVWSEYAFDWRGHLTLYEMPIDTTAVLAEKIALSKKAKNLLAPEEWRPVLLPGLIIKKQWPNASRNNFLLILGSLLTLLILGTVELSLLYPQELYPFGHASIAGLAYFLTGIFTYVIIGYLLFRRFFKRLLRKANWETIILLGKEQYLESYKKLENYLQGLPATERGRDEDLARVRERITEAEQLQTPLSSPEGSASMLVP